MESAVSGMKMPKLKGVYHAPKPPKYKAVKALKHPKLTHRGFPKIKLK
jgi:hypothetical protein